MASPMTMEQAVARRTKLLNDNGYHALKDKKMRDSISQAEKDVKDLESRLNSCTNGFEWSLKLIMGASLEVLMVDDFENYEVEAELEAKKEKAVIELEQLKEEKVKIDKLWDERQQQIRSTEERMRQLLEQDPEYVARRDKKRKEEAEKAHRERCEQTKARALAGWSWHQDNDRETYEKYREIYLEQQRQKEEAYEQARKARQSAQSATQAAESKFAKDAKAWYDLTLKEIKSRQEISSFPAPPAHPNCSDSSCHLKPRPLAPACQCSIRKAFQQIPGLDLKKERARWHPDCFSAFPQYQEKANEIFVAVGSLLNG